MTNNNLALSPGVLLRADLREYARMEPGAVSSISRTDQLTVSFQETSLDFELFRSFGSDFN